MSTITSPVPATIVKIATTPAVNECPSDSTAGANGDVTPDRIRFRAYEIYQARNGNGRTGDAASDWLQAENELNGSAPECTASNDLERRAAVRGERLLAGD